MRDASMEHTRSRPKVFSSTSIIWFVASVLALFALENIWVDPWLRSKPWHIPSMVPEPFGSFWFLALLLVSLSCMFLIAAQLLVAKDRGIPLRKRIGTGSATFLALVLCVSWVRSTSGMSSAPAFGQASKGHSVTLTWKASKSAVKGYNVYRGTRSGGPYTRINADLVRELTYSDPNVRSGMTYYYVARAVDAEGTESANSSEIAATVP